MQTYHALCLHQEPQLSRDLRVSTFKRDNTCSADWLPSTLYLDYCETYQSSAYGNILRLIYTLINSGLATFLQYNESKNFVTRYSPAAGCDLGNINAL